LVLNNNKSLGGHKKMSSSCDNPQQAVIADIIKILNSSPNALTITELFSNFQVGLATEEVVLDCLLEDVSRPDGLVYKTKDEKFGLRARKKEQLRKKVLDQITNQGFKLDIENTIVNSDMSCKSGIRQRHVPARKERFEHNLAFVQKNEEKILTNFADGEEIDLDNFGINVEVVNTSSPSADLFRYTTLLWSVPVSNGFGRRVRFIVRDDSNGKIVGIFALGDPVFNLTCRDKVIGWDWKQRCERLFNVMDVFILGAAPPYSFLLGGKLIAMVAASNEVRETIENRYGNNETVISHKVKDSRLALLTTSSALGKSSLYDRIKYRDSTLYHKIGLTEGYGHFHLNNGLFDEMREFLDITMPGKASHNRFGHGPNWKMRTARESLKQMSLPQDLLRHGIKREVYAVPLATNYKEFLRGETNSLLGYNYPCKDVVEFWKERWLYGRAERKPDYKLFKRDTIRKLIRESESGSKGSGGLNV
jgi:hypothetical protein